MLTWMRSSCFGFAKESGQARASAWSETDSKKNEASLITLTEGLKMPGKEWAPFSLLRRGRSKTLVRFPGSGVFLLAAPSHPSKHQDSGCLRLSWPSQWRDRAGIAPDFPLNPEL